MVLFSCKAYIPRENHCLLFYHSGVECCNVKYPESDKTPSILPELLGYRVNFPRGKDSKGPRRYISTRMKIMCTNNSTSVYQQSNILAIVLLSMLLTSEMNSRIMSVAQQTLLPPSGKSSKVTCLQKPICHSFPCHPCVSFI